MIRATMAAAASCRRRSSGGGGSSTTWAQATAYVQTPPAAAPNVVTVTDWASFSSAIQNAAPGDRIDASGATFTRTSEYVVTLAGTSSAPIDVVLGPGCVFNNTGGQNLPAVWLRNCSWLRWYDGVYSTNSTGGHGIQVNGCHDMYLWLREWNGSKIHYCGGNGVFVSNETGVSMPYTYKGAAVQAGNYRLNLYFGDISQCGLAYNVSGRDPHPVKGTGLHGIQYADNTQGIYDSVLAAYVHDQPTGAAIQAGGSASTDGVFGNTIRLKAVNVTDVVNAGGGNGSALQLWGHNVKDNVVDYIEAVSCAGYAVNTGGMSSGQSLSSDTVTYGRATSCGTHLAAGTDVWNPAFGLVYEDVI